jgi:hypothetical protein
VPSAPQALILILTNSFPSYDPYLPIEPQGLANALQFKANVLEVLRRHEAADAGQHLKVVYLFGNYYGCDLQQEKTPAWLGYYEQLVLQEIQDEYAGRLVVRAGSIWADGIRPREGDGATFLGEDGVGPKVHLSDIGRAKYGAILGNLLWQDPTTASWFIQ